MNKLWTKILFSNNKSHPVLSPLYQFDFHYKKSKCHKCFIIWCEIYIWNIWKVHLPIAYSPMTIPIPNIAKLVIASPMVHRLDDDSPILKRSFIICSESVLRSPDVPNIRTARISAPSQRPWTTGLGIPKFLTNVLASNSTRAYFSYIA